MVAGSGFDPYKRRKLKYVIKHNKNKDKYLLIV